jgi:hypothetical protein
MADNIKIVGSILSTSQVSRYETDDLRLITSLNIKKSFDPFNDYIEYYVYDITSNPLEDNYNYRSYKLPTDESLNPGVTPDLNTTNQTATGAQVGTVSNLNTTSSTYPIIEIDPVQDLQNLGYSSGEFKVQYNIFKNKISSYPSAELFIKEISPDRTEIRVGSVVLTNDQIETGSLALIESYTTSSIFDPFLLNFGNNIQELVTNIVLNRVDTGYEILFKLYNTLDDSITEKSSLWVVEEISTPYVFDINLDAILSAQTGSILRGPNFSNTSRFGLNSTDGPYENQFANDQEGLFKLNNSQSIDININYGGNGSGESGFGSFVTFGSAFSRVHNFYTKVQQIENYNNLIAQYPTYNLISGSLSGSFSSSLQSEINTYSASINSIISNFDGFENYLYFESGSLVSTTRYGITPYPKSGSYKPYVLLPTTSSAVGIWYASSSLNAEDYDLNNVDYFKYSVPGYVVDDPDNENYITFLNMMGQFFDNIWIYIKTIPEINLANNNLEIGISKDLVYNMLQSLGVSIFNSFGNQSIANYLLGANTGSASYNGYLTDFSATGSYINNISKKDILAESYKRIYHNLPLLLQRKGTVAGLRTLLSTFGIPNQDSYTIISGSFSSSYYTPTGSIITSSVLNVKEYGGSTTEGLLAGYNNDKVRIVDNVTASVAGTFGSVLSPYTSILQYTTASSNFRTADEHYVDISFSPQTQLDTYVSKSISSVNNNWSIDNYIGNPQQQYSGSYSDLDNQRKIYFVDGTGSYKGFTNIFYELNNGTYVSGSITGSYEKMVSGLDYNGFIRLIQFFDNSMFKMLEDYVPARTSLSTGVTINSPVLERNKWSYAQPEAINELEKDGSVVAPIFESVYDPFYYNLSGSKVSYINGEIPGSEINVYDDYFIVNNKNPWLGNLQYTSSNAFQPQVSSSFPFPIFGYKFIYETSASLANIFIPGATASFISTPATLSISSASLSSLLDPTGSFDINGIIIAITGSTLPANTATTIYVSTGSTFNDSITNISASFNYSKSLAPYSSSLQYINAYNSFPNLNFTTSFDVNASIANTYYVLSGSTTSYFSGASNNPSTQSVDINGILFVATSSNMVNTNKIIYVPTGSTTENTTQNISVALNFSRSLAPYSSSLQNISSSASASGLLYTVGTYGTLPGNAKPKMPDYNDFIHSDFNVMLNNVSTSLYSTSRKTLEISGSSQIIGSGSFPLLVTASLQDSYLSLSAYTLPRYSGSKTYSAKYNTYTDGDKSYGKTAAIDRYVRKFGLFTQIISSSFFGSRNLVALKYLVDESGSLTELSQTPTSSIDSNWSEVQNTFKLGSNPTVALFDNQQYGDQKKTDGPKSVFDSGYSYYPTLYYSTGSTKLYFQYVGVGTSILFRSNNNNGFINGGPTNQYAPSGGFVYNAFNNIDGTFEGRAYYSLGVTGSFPFYSVSQNITMDFSANFGVNIQFPTASQNASYTFSIVSGSTTLASQTKTFTSSLGNLSSVLDFNVTSSYTNFNPGDKIFFRLLQSVSTGSYTASLLNTGDLTPYTGLRNSISTATTGINPFATSSAAPFISSSNGTDTLFLNESLSSFKDYLYLSETSSADLHPIYGNIDYTFSPKVGDVILLYYNNSTQVQELNVVTAGIIPNGSVFAIKVSPNLVSTLSVSSYTNNTINKLLLLSKIPDETNINLVFDKENGTTSYGFIIPDNLSPDVLKNIDTITRQVKTKILSTNQGITINTV